MKDAPQDPVFDPKGGIERLLAIMARLRDPARGCPWDIDQTWDTIAPYTIEEAYEVADAIERRAWDELQGELGDLLLQVVYFAQFGTEEGRFDFSAIANTVSDKMIARHPHVFGEESRDKTAEQQTRDWEVQKAAEREARGEARVLDGVALGLPALMRAAKLQKRASRVGFDWENPEDVAAKVVEEVAELAAAASPDAVEDEMGDLLFSVVNLARHLGVDPEQALRRTNDKFSRRFNDLDGKLRAIGSSPAEASAEQMEALWEAAKRAERR
ncbi:nucleoside triphosphate pyrophosphohydrolase [Tropicimonas sp. IMCC34043]|uniref:nucleoside triphosphate pyrophosphohydrolase n=1 Tax=Tropicimonas sp. IMCC34043 TaxID=2248760 RepID=UPI000E22C61D|nr:nucleoside triphosphate pyrophosphohydrolase [Tropicimonas sp. IMCC34043]